MPATATKPPPKPVTPSTPSTPGRIQVRDVVRKRTLELGPDEPILRGSYDLFRPKGPVVVRDELIEWLEGETLRTSRVVASTLGSVHAGERVLLRLDASAEEWWLCDVEAVDGVEGNV